MKPLPISETYERELIYFPYKKSLETTVDIIYSRAPGAGRVIDLMCGPGYLLGMIEKRRPDLSLLGMDIDKGYIKHAKEKYPQIEFEVGDVLTWEPKERANVVICTGALHHIHYENQEEVIRKMMGITEATGFTLLSDCYIDHYLNETKRKLAAAKLGYEYLKAAIENSSPDDVTKAAIDIMHNDVMMEGEFKDSLKNRLPKFEKCWGSDVKTIKTWPDKNTEYGDYITLSK